MNGNYSNVLGATLAKILSGYIGRHILSNGSCLMRPGAHKCWAIVSPLFSKMSTTKPNSRQFV
jgi:hypothetical protein